MSVEPENIDTEKSEKDFQSWVCSALEDAGWSVFPEVWCSVFDDSGAGNGTRRADVYAEAPEPLEGWCRSVAIECKLDGQLGLVRQGMWQAISYMRAFDWRASKVLTKTGQRFCRPDIALLATPATCALVDIRPNRSTVGDEPHFLLERMGWDHGVSVMRRTLYVSGMSGLCFRRRDGLPSTALTPAETPPPVPFSVNAMDIVQRLQAETRAQPPKVRESGMDLIQRLRQRKMEDS